MEDPCEPRRIRPTFKPPRSSRRSVRRSPMPSHHSLGCGRAIVTLTGCPSRQRSPLMAPRSRRPKSPWDPDEVRGLVLHKLMEEILTGEVAEAVQPLAERAASPLLELAIDTAGYGRAAFQRRNRRNRLENYAACRKSPRCGRNWCRNFPSTACSATQPIIQPSQVVPTLLRLGTDAFRSWWTGKAMSPPPPKTSGRMLGKFATT